MKLLFNLLLLVILSGLTAAAIVGHEAADVSGIKSSGGDPVTADVLDLLEQAAIKRSSPLEVSEADLNEYLAATLRGRLDGVIGRVTQFDRLLVDLEPGCARVVLCWNTGGMRTTSTLELACAREGAHHRAEVTSGALGRLALPRGFLAPVLPAYAALAKACDAEIKALFNMTRIEIGKDKLVLDPRY